MNNTSHDRDQDDHPRQPSGITRADLLKTSLAGSLSVPFVGALATDARAASGGLTVAPRYFPLRHFRPRIDLAGKLAVVTGASRGNGRAVGEALVARGVDVIGTSRNPAAVPDPPAFPLLRLDVADPTSVLAFPAALAAHPSFRARRSIDILVNNAGRIVVGRIVPLSPSDFAFYSAQREVAVRTLYTGHVQVTNVLLPLMAAQGYGRILFTVSAASYYTGSTLPVGSAIDAYHASKAALRAYANNLGAALREGGSTIRVSTINPYVMNTALSEHPNPIYTQPVNSSGLSDTDQLFNAAITGGRQLLANGLPPAMVGDTAVQLAQMSDPLPNVVVASPKQSLATKGQNSMVESQLSAENDLSALPFRDS
jgi:NAD(P)-dependent dehydrogenase (short-subunit alcohol dehydrogenase family)